MSEYFDETFGFSSVMLNFESWSVAQFHQWVDALPSGLLSASGRRALLDCFLLSGDDLKFCTNKSSSHESTPAAGLRNVVPKLTDEDAYSICDELDALRELRTMMPQGDDESPRNDIASSELHVASLQRKLQEEWSQFTQEGQHVQQTTVGATKASAPTHWSEEWQVRDAPPIVVASTSCPHMNSDTDSDAESGGEEKESGSVQSCTLRKNEPDEFDELLDEAVDAYRRQHVERAR